MWSPADGMQGMGMPACHMRRLMGPFPRCHAGPQAAIQARACAARLWYIPGGHVGEKKASLVWDMRHD